MTNPINNENAAATLIAIGKGQVDIDFLVEMIADCCLETARNGHVDGGFEVAADLAGICRPLYLADMASVAIRAAVLVGQGAQRLDRREMTSCAEAARLWQGDLVALAGIFRQEQARR